MTRRHHNPAPGAGATAGTAAGSAATSGTTTAKARSRAGSPGAPAGMLRAGAGRGRRGGWAMVGVLVLMTVLVALTSVVATASSVDRDATYASAGLEQARAGARAALDVAYRLVNTNPGWVPPAGWVQVVDGQLAPCPATPSADTVCVQLVRRTDPLPTDAVSAGVPRAAVQVLQATARTRCRAGSDVCVYSRFQQRLRQRQFSDFMFYTQFSALDPVLYPAGAATGWPYTQTQAMASCANRYEARVNVADGNLPPRPTGTSGCVEVAYQADTAGDQVSGPVFTNDDSVVVCGRPVFTGPVLVGGSGSPVNASALWHRPADATGCTEPTSADVGAVFSGGLRQALPFLLPSSTLSGAGFKAVTATAYQLTPATAGGTVTLRLVQVGATSRIVVSGAAQYPSGTSLALPANGTVYVDAPRTDLSGVLAGALSVFSTGQLWITGDVTYATNPLTAPASAPSRDVLGLTAAGQIVFTPPTVNGQVRTVDAILLSLDRAVYVDRWDATPTRATPGVVGTLRFLGAMAARYQGVFGGYERTTGALVNGYHKAFTFDARVADGQVAPPYLFWPTTGAWVRQDVAEVVSCGGQVGHTSCSGLAG